MDIFSAKLKYVKRPPSTAFQSNQTSTSWPPALSCLIHQVQFLSTFKLMAQPQTPESFVNEEKLVPRHVSVKEEHVLSESQTSQPCTKPENDGRQPVPLTWKLASIVLVTAIGFGSQWSSA
jgi:hypothetical protein